MTPQLLKTIDRCVKWSPSNDANDDLGRLLVQLTFVAFRATAFPLQVIVLNGNFLRTGVSIYTIATVAWWRVRFFAFAVLCMVSMMHLSDGF